MNERIKNLRKTLDLTQEAFSTKIGLSRNFIAQVEIGTRTPSDRTISDICREFDVNENWLRNGTGEMFRTVSKNEVIAEFTADVLNDEEESFRRRFLSAIADMNDDGWNALEKLIDDIQKKD